MAANKGTHSNDGPCLAEGCERDAKCKSLCMKHYQRQYKYGNLTDGDKERVYGTPTERFLKKFEQSSGCWEWQSVISAAGYGVLGIDKPEGKRNVFAHRFSYEHFVGPIPEGLVIDHLCRNRKCVNPAHLEPVTGAENTRRGLPFNWDNYRDDLQGRAICIRGHQQDDDNRIVYTRKTGETAYDCRACRKQKNDARPRKTARRANQSEGVPA